MAPVLNLVTNAIVGFALGFLVGSAVLYFYPYDPPHWPR